MDTGRQGQIDSTIAGQVLGDRYQLVSVLGAGGMGTVYKATHLALGRTVAIKLLHPHIVGDERSVQRFNLEMQAMSALNHPHLIAITDAGITKQGAPYFVMEYLEGRSLSEELDRGGNLEETHALKIALQITDALDYAHSKGIVHRDLKPNNIMLIGRNDFVKVVDLGIAKLASMGTGPDSMQKLTQTGEIFGSPLYMSPEQCLAKNVDNRADIYGLGCLIYEMVTNNLPIKGETPIETLMRHISDPPMPMSQAPGFVMTPGAALIEPVIMHCLEKDPARRFQSMADLHHALEHVLQQCPATTNFVASSNNEQRETRLSQGQIVAPIVGPGSGMPAPRVEYNPPELPGEQGSRVREQADSDRFGTTNPPSSDATIGGGSRNTNGNQGDSTNRGGTAGGISASRPLSGGTAATGPSFNYIPLAIIAAAAVIGIIGVVSVVIVMQPRNAPPSLPPTVVYGSQPNLSKTYEQIQLDIVERNQREHPDLPINQGSEGVQLSSGDTPTQVFMVNEYMGVRPEEFKDNPNEWGNTSVIVKYEQKPIVLFLSAYAPVDWVVKRESSKVRIEKIIANGYHAMRVEAPPGVPVIRSWYERRDQTDQHTKERSHENPFPWFTFCNFQDVKSHGGWAEVAKTVKQTTGQEVYKFWGKYTGSSFTLE